MLTCPKCDKDMHPVCSRMDCVCRTGIPAGELPMQDGWVTFGGIRLSRRVGDIIWKIAWILHPGRQIEKLYHRIAKKYLTSGNGMGLRISWIGVHPSSFLMELEICPYCGYADSWDYWEDRNITQTFPDGFPQDEQAPKLARKDALDSRE